jgi:hypothetical protein
VTYSFNGEFYRAMRVTSPTHNLLGIALSEGIGQGVTVERLAESAEQPIDELALEKAVISGVQQANKAFGTNYCLKRIQYVPTDTPDLETYSYLARKIIERLASGLKFDAISPQGSQLGGVAAVPSLT